MDSGRLLSGCVAVAAGSAVALAQAPAPPDPFAVLRSCAAVSADDRARLDAGQTVARTLPGEGREIVVFGARRIAADGDRLVQWVHHIDQFKRSPLVEAISRFSDPPRLEDLDDLSLDDGELQDIRKCRPGDCGAKLTAEEIASLQRGLSPAGDDGTSWLQIEIRRLMLDRVRAYAAGGHAALARYDDGRSPRPMTEVFGTILARSPCLARQVPDLAAYLGGFPDVAAGPLESFLYWSKERFRGRPVVSATHVVIARPGDDRRRQAIVAGKQVFATHYLNGSLNLTAILGGGDAPHYLVVLNRTHVDVVHGPFGGLVRLMLERRLRSELAQVLEGMTRRLEGGEPEPSPGLRGGDAEAAGAAPPVGPERNAPSG